MQNYYITICDENAVTMIHMWITLWKPPPNKVTDMKKKEATEMEQYILNYASFDIQISF